MAATLCGKLLLRQATKPHKYAEKRHEDGRIVGWLPVTHCVRHGSKAVTRHRKPMHFLKQKLLAVTEYIPPKKLSVPKRVPEVKPDLEETTGLVKLLKREVRDVFQECKMIGVVHNSSANTEDMLLLKHRLRRHGIAVRFFPNQVMRDFLEGSPYSNMLPLFIGPTILLVCKEPKVKEMLQALRALPLMVLMGACVENALLSHQGLVSYSKLPSVSTVQGMVVSALSLQTSQTASALQHHPARLSALLQQYVTQKGPEGAAAGAE